MYLFYKKPSHPLLHDMVKIYRHDYKKYFAEICHQTFRDARISKVVAAKWFQLISLREIFLVKYTSITNFKWKVCKNNTRPLISVCVQELIVSIAVTLRTSQCISHFFIHVHIYEICGPCNGERGFEITPISCSTHTL